MAVKNFNEVDGVNQGLNNTRIFRGHSTVGRTFADSKLYDIELVKQDLLNHFNIIKGEKLENPEFGTNIWLYLFDPLDDELKAAVIEDVEENVRGVATAIRESLPEVAKEVIGGVADITSGFPNMIGGVIDGLLENSD